MATALTPASGPSPARLLDPAAKDAFWLVVEDCLFQFHRLDKLSTIQRARTARQAAEATLAGLPGDLIYHLEPFYLACDIAGIEPIAEQERLLSQYRPAYKSILKKRDW